MQRWRGRLLVVAGALAVVACSPSEDVSEDTAVPTPSIEPSGSGSEESDTSDVSEEPATLPPISVEPSDTAFALPGLVDPSDEPIDNDDPLLKLDNAILSPHAICWTDEIFRGNGRAACQSILDVASGKIPRDVVNREVIERPGLLAKLALFGK